MNSNRSCLKIVAKSSEHKIIIFQGTRTEDRAELKLASLVKNYIFNILNLDFLKRSKGTSFPKLMSQDIIFSRENKQR